MHNLANLYKQRKKYNQSEKYYLMAIENNNIKSINNLADLYYVQRNYNLAEKYYLLAIDYDNSNKIINLINIYEKQKKYDFVKKYLLFAANYHHTEAKSKINLLLKKKFDIDFAIKANEFLNEKNLKLLNSIVCYVENNTNNFSSILINNMDCMKCKETKKVIFISCGHPICTQCYDNETKCTICT